jgi:hypothetical protein
MHLIQKHETSRISYSVGGVLNTTVMFYTIHCTSGKQANQIRRHIIISHIKGPPAWSEERAWRTGP